MEILLILVGLIGLAAFVWLVVVAFQVHVLWGLACLFLPFAALVFSILHWGRASRPFIAHLGSSLLGLALAWSYVGSLVASFDPDAMQAQAKGIQEVQQEILRRMQSGEMTEAQAKDEMRLVVAAAMQGQPYRPSFMPAGEQDLSLRVEVDRSAELNPAAFDAKIEAAIAREDEHRAQQAVVPAAPAPTPRRVQTYVAKDPRGAAADLGKAVRITVGNGSDRSGSLVEVSAAGELIVEQRMHGGRVRYTLDPRILSRYEVQEWVLR